MEPVVTVGLDGSPESMAAARWAADEAERRKVTLRLMHTWPMLAPEPVRAASEIDHFLGSVSMAVVARATRPVVLVRAEVRERGSSPAFRSVVVALKPHGPCDGLLAFAYEAAAARGVPLQVVHGRSLPLHAHTPWGLDHDAAKEITEEAQKQLAQILRPWREKFPGVEPVDAIRLASPAEAVVRAAEGADLLVGGRRTHRPALAPRLGPVAHAALHHARCPVAVVPHD
ncbi:MULTISPECIES: universal stress protein [unclassified Streptomyces]|uniref:universal stress protein n=1 Tax=unclassified Streptomyces TaxID=2593676 RepID=UPI0006F86539|nr:MULTISPECIES: universal stress protein [unclassified Streptomyces]KQX51410.1 stress-inducible protein [Streptomyces sp. Root1304]KRA85577.1 stress-inducible protein [Streptomyces sp. Root66D1]